MEPPLGRSGATEVALQVNAVSKRYAPPTGLLRIALRSAARTPVDALRDVSLVVERGEVVALVGQNGAGKTTLLKIISTLVRPTSGKVEVDGVDLQLEPASMRRRLGLVLAEDRGLYWRLTGRQNLEFFGVAAGLSAALARARATAMLEAVGLDDSDRLVFGYSSGMRTRLNLARALLHEPPLLLLDEPTRSIDPVATEQVWTLIRDVAAAGTAVLTSCHDVGAVARWCDRVVVLADGRVRHSLTVADFPGSGDPARAITSALADGAAG